MKKWIFILWVVGKHRLHHKNLFFYIVERSLHSNFDVWLCLDWLEEAEAKNPLKTLSL